MYVVWIAESEDSNNNNNCVSFDSEKKALSIELDDLKLWRVLYSIFS